MRRSRNSQTRSSFATKAAILKPRSCSKTSSSFYCFYYISYASAILPNYINNWPYWLIFFSLFCIFGEMYSIPSVRDFLQGKTIERSAKKFKGFTKYLKNTNQSIQRFFTKNALHLIHIYSVSYFGHAILVKIYYIFLITCKKIRIFLQNLR